MIKTLHFFLLLSTRDTAFYLFLLFAASTVAFHFYLRKPLSKFGPVLERLLFCTILGGALIYLFMWVYWDWRIATDWLQFNHAI